MAATTAISLLALMALFPVDTATKKGFVYSSNDKTSPSRFSALHANWYYK
jgi:hypothetical protein